MARKRQAESYLERQFERAIRRFFIPEPSRQHRFHDWYFDFAWKSIRVAVEIDGGTYHKSGGHARGKRYQKDCIKNNKAQVEGWVVLRADREMVGSYDFAMDVKRVINKRLNMAINNKLLF